MTRPPPALLYRNWPTGIRLDQAAVSIGAVGSPRAARRTPTVSHQSRGLFICPWPAVRGIRVASPFMRAALVIEVDLAAVTTSQIRPARYYSNYKNGYFSRLIPPRPSPVWVVPSRHPEALRKALGAVSGYRELADDMTSPEAGPGRAN